MNSAHVVRRPYPPLLLRVFRSSMLMWLLARVTYMLVVLFGVPLFAPQSVEEGIQSALHPVWPSRLLLVLVTVVLVHLDRKLAHEHLLQANFGVRAVWFWATSFVAAGLSDLTVQALLLII